MEEYYSVNQAAIALKVHPLTIRRYIRDGKLKAIRVGGNIRITLNELRAFTQNFVPQTRVTRSQQTSQTKPFSYSDPLLNLKGKGLSMSKLEDRD